MTTPPAQIQTLSTPESPTTAKTKLDEAIPEVTPPTTQSSETSPVSAPSNTPAPPKRANRRVRNNLSSGFNYDLTEFMFIKKLVFFQWYTSKSSLH